MENDGCFIYHGKYVDLVRSDIDGTWSVLYDNKRIARGLPTKTSAYIWWFRHHISALHNAKLKKTKKGE